MKNYILLLNLTLVMISSSFSNVFAFTDQATTERILTENKEYIEFINVCVTNFTKEKYADFEDVYRIHFNADIAYLQSDYKRSYKKVYASQRKMSLLYETLLRDLYLEDAKKILDRMAPGIIKSKNPRARLYLTLGYRDRTVSVTHYTIGNASNPRLFSYKIFKYEEGIKMARRSKRYGFLALFESRTSDVKKAIYNQLLKKEKEKGQKFYNRFLDKKGEPFIKELNLSFDENEKREEKAGIKTTFEKKVLKRVRFRQEARTARFLMNHEFDRAEDIMRKYVDDFNYKLIDATFDVLKADPKGTSAPAFDYDKMKIHLMDNYLRLSRQSAIETFLDKLKVEDDMKSHREDDGSTGKEKKDKKTTETKEPVKKEPEKNTEEKKSE